jgi:hypothetical protein
VGVLSHEEELKLVEFLLNVEALGLGLSPALADSYVLRVVEGRDHPFSSAGPSKFWWLTFRRRCPVLTLRKPEKLTRSRAVMANGHVMLDHAGRLQALFSAHRFPAGLVFNADEPKVDPRPPTVFSVRSSAMSTRSTTTRSHTTRSWAAWLPTARPCHLS